MLQFLLPIVLTLLALSAPARAQPQVAPEAVAAHLPDLDSMTFGASDRAYRLLLIPYAGPMQVITLSTSRPDIRYPPCDPRADCNHPLPPGMLRIQSTFRTAERHLAEEALGPLIAALAGANFDTLEPRLPHRPCRGAECVAGACPGYMSFVLEAQAGSRYHHVAGSACDHRGLDEALRVIVALGGGPRWR